MITIFLKILVHGSLQFSKDKYFVSKSHDIVEIPILRVISNDGDVAVKWKTKDMTALNGLNYTGGEGVIKFEHDQTHEYVLKFPLFDLDGKEGDILFEIKLYNPEGGATVENNIQTVIGE